VFTTLVAVLVFHIKLPLDRYQTIILILFGLGFIINTLSDSIDLSVRDGPGFKLEEIGKASMFESSDFFVDCLFMLVLHIFYFKIVTTLAMFRESTAEKRDLKR